MTGSNGSNGSNMQPPPGYKEGDHPGAPQMLMKSGGNVLSSPKIVPIFFSANDTMKAQLEQFTQQVAGSPYWRAIASEYGIGDLTLATSIVTADAAPTTDSALDTWLGGHFNGANGWPSSPDPQALYTVFLPTDNYNATATGLGQACVNYGAYHYETAKTGTTTPIVYALMPRCNAGTQYELEDLTVSASHEWIEAATDPHVNTAGGYQEVSDDQYAWAWTPGAEVGDMCEYVDAAIQPLIGSFNVQRTWSNAAAAAGKDPCVPSNGPYLGVAPVFTDMVPIPHYDGTTAQTKGMKLAVGASTTIDVDLFSDVDAPAWTVEAKDGASFLGGTAELQLSLDKTSGKNGDKLRLTIKRLAAGNTTINGSEFVLLSKQNGTSVAQWWGFVSN